MTRALNAYPIEEVEYVSMMTGENFSKNMSLSFNLIQRKQAW